MSFILCLIFTFLFLSCKEGPQEISQNYADDPTNPSVQPRVVGVWLDSPRPYWWRKTNEFGNQNDSMPIGYKPGRLFVRFNKIMLSYTVIPNVNLTPQEIGFASLHNDHGFSIDGQTFELPLYGIFKLKNSYTITIKKEVSDITNLNLSQDYNHLLIPEPHLRIIDTSPSDGDSNTYIPSRFYASFNSTIDVKSLATGVAIIPPTEGRWESAGYSTVAFVPNAGFKGATWYEFNFSQTVKDTSNNYLKHRFKIKFKTVRFKLFYTHPRNGQHNIDRGTKIYCNFLYPLDVATIRDNFFITPQTLGNLNYSYSSFEFSPSNLLVENTTYNVTIGTGLRSKAGDTLTSPYTFSFTTGSN